MNIIEIRYPPYVGVDVYNDNSDMFVDMEDGVTYTVTLWTPNNYYWYMDKEQLNYVPFGCPDMHVQSLTNENITQSIEDYARDDAYFLKLSFLGGGNRQEAAFCIEEMNDIIRKMNKQPFVWDEAPANERHELEIIEIEYPPNYEDVNKDEGCIPVVVKANDGMTYHITVITPNYYYCYMQEHGIGYIPASPPHLKVRSLTKEYIRQALEACLEDDGYALKFYFIAQ
ncbi:hypothetical protein, partial [Paenibacillus popilliae]